MTYQTPKEIMLRDATPDDRDALCALHIRSWRANYSKELPAKSLGDVLENDMRNRWVTRSFAWPELIIVAEVPDERRHHVTSIVGFICVLADNDPPLIDNLHVVSEWQSHGLGATLVQSALERLSHKGFEAAVLGVLASNTRARQFYARIGGQDTGGSEEVLMGKPVVVRHIRFDTQIKVSRFAEIKPSAIYQHRTNKGIKMHIGLIGGIGPAATISYYKQLVAQFGETDLPLKLTIEHAEMSVLLQNALHDRRQAQAEVFAKHLDNLAAVGCDISLITALTGHFCFEETHNRSPIPLMDGTAVIDTYCTENRVKSLGILGSPSVLKTKLFGLLNTAEIIVPRAGLDDLGDTYMKLTQTGICTNAQRSQLFEAGRSMIEEDHAEAILLAGTDLGLAFDNQAPGFVVIDALKLHVSALVARATNASA